MGSQPDQIGTDDSRGGSSDALPSNVGSGANVKVSTGSETINNGHHRLQDEKLESLAIIGFSLKFPQEAVTPEAFWKMLTEKRCAMTEWPKDRMKIDAFYHPDGSRCDTIPFRGGHFLKESLEHFDAPFFSITAADAAAMDPQHRLLLETAYKALENAGIPMEKASGSRTSVHTGCFTDDYKSAITKDLNKLPKYAATGLAVSMLAARLSWFFDLRGPCVNLDSACSSSMMAFDLACQGLRNGDAEMAVVAGTSIAYSVDVSLPLSLMNFFSKDSKSFSFDHRANGYGRGEGFGVVVLKRLRDAVRDGDTIRAVVRSTASNQDGRTPGITQPSTDAQEHLIRETYEKAGLGFETTRYVEAHGTGTAIGDPVEASAIGRVFRNHRSPKEPIYIGAVKSNIGHLEGASGVASIIKTIMILEAGVIPPNANFERLNPDIDAEFLRIKIPVHNTPWPSAGVRRASISSFGFGGSNSHAIIDDACNFLRLRGIGGKHSTALTAPSVECLERLLEPLTLLPLTRVHPEQGMNGLQEASEPRLFVWSASDKDGLARMANAYSVRMSELSSSLSVEEADIYLKDLAYTLAERRSSLAWKSFIVAKSITELNCLDTKLSTPVRSRVSPRLGYIFTGQGAQFAGMAKELFAFTTFLNSFRRSEIYLEDLGCEWSLKDELAKGKAVSKINDPAYSQVLCTALQIALVDLLQSFNVFPSAVIGHSSGEIAAAYCVGGLSQQSACKVAYFRGKHAAKLARSSQARRAMMSVGLSQDLLTPYLRESEIRFGSVGVVVACINGPKNTTVSGYEAQLDLLKSLLDRDSIFARKLQVNVAYHSPQMNEIATAYAMSLSNLDPGEASATKCVMVSSVTGRKVSLTEIQQSEYWVNNMVSPVRFSDALSQICAQATENLKKLESKNAIEPVTDLLEIGPHNTLLGPTNDTLKKLRADVSYSSALLRPLPADDTLLNALGRLYCYGYSVDNSKANRSGHEQKVLSDLPEYPFNHSKSYWHENRLSKDGFRLRVHPRLDLLGTRVQDWNPLEPKWRHFLRASEMPWMKDHSVTDAIVYPAAGMIVMALEAAKQIADENQPIKGYFVKNAVFSSPLSISLESDGVEIEVYVHPFRSSTERTSMKSEFRLCSQLNGQWNENCRAIVQVEYETPATEVDGGKEATARSFYYSQLYKKERNNCNGVVSAETMYAYMQNIGLSYGPSFQVLEQLSYGTNGQAMGSIRAFQWVADNNTNHPQPHVIHPTTLDGFLQLMLVALSRGSRDDIPTMMPTRIGKLWISSSGISYPQTTAVDAYAKTVFSSRRTTDALLFALDQTTGRLLLALEDAEATTVATRKTAAQDESNGRKMCYRMSWKPDIELFSRQQSLVYCETARPHRPSPVEYYENLDFVIIKFMSNALEALQEGESSASQSHLRQYTRWLRHQNDRFQCGKLPYRASDHPKWKAILEDPQYWGVLCNAIEVTGQGKFFVKIGRNLLKMLQGDVDPLNFMFQDDSVSEFYREVNREVICYEPLNRYLDLMCHKTPARKILEIGAGTGSTTDFILEALSANEQLNTGTMNCSQYDYTDISPAFFEAASDRYERYGDKLRFKVLDIESDPFKQGFEPGTYDLIFAASVLHATKNLDVTIRNARSLLKPGGKLIMWEITEDTIRSGFAFGLLPGWWLSEDEYREHGPCISTTEWDEVMLRNGFSGIELETPDFMDKGCHEYSILISTAVEPVVERLPTPSSPESNCPKLLIIVTKHNAAQLTMANTLMSRLTSSSKSKDCSIVTLEETSAIVDLNSRFCISLTEADKPILSNINKSSFDGLRHILTNALGILWTTNGGGHHLSDPSFHLIDGLARVARAEFNQVVFVTLALENTDIMSDAAVETVLRTFETISRQCPDDLESEYVERDKMLEIGRVVEAGYLNQDLQVKTSPNQVRMREFGSVPALALQIGSPGLLDSLYFSEDDITTKPLASGEVEIKVESAGVNFRDCLTVLGQINAISLGSECAGIVSRVGEGCELRPGDRVTACFANTIKTYARGSEACVMKLPDSFASTEASAVPVVFVTAWHALCDVAKLQRGESILIHAGAGGTGQAAIQIAKYLGAEMFVTVGSNDKKRLLMSLYDIPQDHILYSRNTSFTDGIMRLTNGRGVDVVLNSLSGESLLASWECIAQFGRFIEIGKQDINSRNNLPMWQFNKVATFSSVDLYPLFRERPAIARGAFSAVMQLFAENILHIPQPFRVFGVSEIEEALRLLQSGRAPGKMAIEMRNSNTVRTVLDTKPDYQFHGKSSYLIAGGLGGLGRSAARWMASRGAKNLILLSRSGARSEANIMLVKDLKAMGVCVEALPCDVTDAESLRTALARCAKTMPPINGCMQACMHLSDAILENMTFEDWKLGIGPKVEGTWNLHRLLPCGMDFFICFSSVSGIIGSIGAANYCAGNTFMDAFVQHRIMLGEKATSLDLGWMESEGVVAENSFLLTNLAARGFLIPMSQTEFHAVLDYHCNPSLAIMTPSTGQIILGLQTPATMRAKDLPEPHWMQRSTFRHLQQIGLGAPSLCQAGKAVDYVARFRDAATLEDRTQIVIECLVRKLAKALSIPQEDLDTSRPLHTYGVDSLLAVELRNYLAKEMDADVTIFDIMGGASFQKVSATVAQKSQLVQLSQPPVEGKEKC